MAQQYIVGTVPIRQRTEMNHSTSTVAANQRKPISDVAFHPCFESSSQSAHDTLSSSLKWK